LPLDAHPTLGNNAQLCTRLGLKKRQPFFLTKGQLIGWRCETSVPRDRLGSALASAVGSPPTVIPAGPDLCRRIGVVTGGAGEELAQAAAEGVDTFITGEGKHWTYALAEDLGLNVFYAGHYATETFGVKALAQRLSKQFKMPWEFLDHPTGL
jgi:putative NIF3 family GTP cyclohydrolase 1 type 2